MRTTRKTADRIVFNEMTTQASGVAVDALEAIGRRPFDAVTTVESPDDLTDPGEFGGCDLFELCADVDDFDGLTFRRTVEGFEYEVEVDVWYVDPDSPGSDTPTGPSYAKQVRVRVTNPHIFVGDPSNPLEIEMHRTYTYLPLAAP